MQRTLSSCAIAFVVLLCVVSATATLSNDPVTHNKPLEMHHSLRVPLDKNQVYWSYGGSTVLSNKHIRLTPSTQSRAGWLWNQYPLESENWEVEFRFEIFSKPHFGGDGMAFWVLNSDMDPTLSGDPEFLNGPLFGLKNKYHGFGVIIDIYDNDNRRNNPSIFVLENTNGEDTKYNHDNDYENDMVARKPPNAPAPPNNDPLRYSGHRCVADVRNTGKASRMLVKLVDKILHVYVDTADGLGYKFCLSTVLNSTYKDYHYAFTSATGQVADTMDILEVNTRYLSSNEAIHDEDFMALESGSSAANREHRTLSSLFWFVISLIGAGLTGFTAYQIVTFRQLVSNKIDSVRVCAHLNQYLLQHYLAHAVLTVLLLVSFNWIPFLLNVWLVLWRAFEFQKKRWMFSPAQIGGLKGHASTLSFSLLSRLLIPLVLYSIMQLYYFYQLFF